MKVVAFALVLVFSQRLGLNLWMHHFYHEGTHAHETAKNDLPHWELRCDCYDDAFMPMDEAYVFELRAPRVGYLLIETPYIPRAVYAFSVQPSLRGPPAPFFV